MLVPLPVYVLYISDFNFIPLYLKVVQPCLYRIRSDITRRSFSQLTNQADKSESSFECFGVVNENDS